MNANLTQSTQAISITFGDVAENHAGMQMIGTRASRGYTLEEMMNAQAWFESRGAECRMVRLHDLFQEDTLRTNPMHEAYVLVIKNATNILLEDENGSDAMMKEQDGLKKDTKAKMYGRVVNKHARHNLCFGEAHQEPNYMEGKGTVYAFDEVPRLQRVREKLEEILGEPKGALQAEGNYYYDVKKCGIGYHGDAERKKVVALRFGRSIPLCYAWFHENERCSEVLRLTDLEHGDMYMMSEKATGYDWRSKSKYTLRHAAGCEKYTSV